MATYHHATHLSQVFVPQIPPALNGYEPAAFAFESEGHRLLTDDRLVPAILRRLTVYSTDVLSQEAVLAYAHYNVQLASLTRYPERLPHNPAALLAHLQPIFDGINDWLRARGSWAFWSATVVEDAPCFVARMLGKEGHLIDLVTIELEPMRGNHFKPHVPFRNHHFGTPFFALWSVDAFAFGSVDDRSPRNPHFKVATFNGRPAVIPTMGRVGHLNQVGAMAGLALVAEAMERTWESTHHGAELLDSSRVAANVNGFATGPPSPSLPNPFYRSSNNSPTSSPPISTLAPPATENPTNDVESSILDDLPTSGVKETAKKLLALLSRSYPNEPSSEESPTTILITNILHRALEDPSIAPLAAGLTKALVGNSTTEEGGSEEETQSSVLEALKEALRRAERETNHPGFFKLVGHLVDLGMLEEVGVRDIVREVFKKGGGGRGRGNE